MNNHSNYIISIQIFIYFSEILIDFLNLRLEPILRSIVTFFTLQELIYFYFTFQWLANYLRIIYYYKISMLSIQNQDEYNNDVKPDQSVPPFTDSISHIAWAPTIPNIFACTTWDGDLRIIEVTQNQLGRCMQQRFFLKMPQPALKCTWNDQSSQLFIGLIDGTVKAMDINTQQTADIFKHTAAINSLHYIPNMNSLICSGYDTSIKCYQIGNPSPSLTIDAQNKVFTSDFQYPYLIAGTSNEKLLYYDLKGSLKTVLDSTDLGKNSQIQSITINQKGTNYGVATFDGRANISSINKNASGIFVPKTLITFKSNKAQESGATILYPINSIGFHPSNDRWFMTAGSDGFMHFWDYEVKNKIKSFSYSGIPICHAKVNPSGEMVAYGLGNDWHIGAQGSKWTPKIGIHIITEPETKYTK